ncbi:MAG: hypothetical protein V2A75_08075 [Pseudomonadota bacterium]
MKIIILLPTLMSVALLTGCVGKTVYVDRIVEVKVPVPCKMKEVKPAIPGANDAVTTADIVRERDELRKSNNGCQ